MYKGLTLRLRSTTTTTSYTTVRIIAMYIVRKIFWFKIDNGIGLYFVV